MMALSENHAINIISFNYFKVLIFQHNFPTLAVISTLLNDFMLVENYYLISNNLIIFKKI